MAINPSALSIFQVKVDLLQKTPVSDLQKQVDNFKQEWQTEAYRLTIPADRDMFMLEVNQLWQTLSTTLATLSAAGAPYAEIMQKMRSSFDSAKAQLSLSLTRFNMEKAVFVAASAQFEQHAVASSKQNFAAFKSPKVTVRTGAIPTYARKPKVDMEAKKTELARCVQISMDPESTSGVMLCLAHHSKGLSGPEKKELTDVVPKALIGKGINDLVMPLATVSMAINKTINAVIQGFVYNGCLKFDPIHHRTMYAASSELMEGRNLRANQAIKETLPNWTLTAARYVIHANLHLAAFDESLQREYFTCPGIVHEACLGVIDLATYKATSLIWKGAGLVTRAAGQAVDRAVELAEEVSYSMLLKGRVYAFAKSEMGGITPKNPFKIASSGTSEKNVKALIEAQEHQAIKRVQTQVAEFIPPVGWKKSTPQYFKSEFLKFDCKVDQKKVTIFAKKFDDSLLYIHSTKFRREATIGTKYKLPFSERIEMGFKALIDVAERNRLSRIMIAWDPKVDAFATFLEAHGIPIKSMGTLSSVKSKVLMVAELSMEKIALLRGDVNKNPVTKIGQLAQVTLDRKLIWQDFGLKPKNLYQVYPGSPKRLYALDGYAKASNDQFIVKVERIRAPELSKINMKAWIKRMKDMARENGVSELTVRIDHYQDAFLKLMRNTFGEPTCRKYSNEIYTFAVRKTANRMSTSQASVSSPGKPKTTQDLLKNILLLSQESLDGASNPLEINVSRVMTSADIPHYGFASEKSKHPIALFLEDKLKGPFSKMTHEANPTNSNHFYTIYSPDVQPIAFIKDFPATHAPQGGFIPEIVANSYMKGYRLKNVVTPTIEGVGQYVSLGGADRGVILYSWGEGETVAALYSQKSRAIPAGAMGRGLGEINRITSKGPVSPEYLEKKIRLFKFLTERHEKEMAKLGRGLFTSREAEMIINDVRPNPGLGGVVYGDVHPGNMLYKVPNLTFVDPASLLQSLNRAGVSHGMPAIDRYQVLTYLKSYGTHYGYSQAEIDHLSVEFLRGYRELFPYPHIPEVERFAELYCLMNLMNKMLQHERPYGEHVITVIRTIEEKFGKTPFVKK